MKALILAAGLGTRLKPRTNSIPKCLLKIKGVPLLDIWIKKILDTEIREIFINTHYLSEQVYNFIREKNYPIKINLLNERKLLGTAGTLKQNIESFLGDDLLLVHGDNYMKENLNNLILTHMQKPEFCLMTIVAFLTENPQTCGIIEVDNNNILKSFIEKPKFSENNLANGAVYILTNSLLKKIKILKGKTKDFSTDVIPKCINKALIYHTKESFIDIGNEKAYLKAQKL